MKNFWMRPSTIFSAMFSGYWGGCRGVRRKAHQLITVANEIVEKHNPLNFGDMKTGNVFNVSRDEIHEQVRDTSIVHFVFNDQDTVARVLAELKAADLGPSVIVSGLVDRIKTACGHTGLAVHTIEFSGGVHGRTELLPDEKTLSLTTMCGHGMIAKALVKHLASRVKRGKLSLYEAATEMAFMASYTQDINLEKKLSPVPTIQAKPEEIQQVFLNII